MNEKKKHTKHTLTRTTKRKQPEKKRTSSAKTKATEIQQKISQLLPCEHVSTYGYLWENWQYSDREIIIIDLILRNPDDNFRIMMIYFNQTNIDNLLH